MEKIVISQSGSKHQRLGMAGFSLVELMVVVALSLVAMLVIGKVFEVSEARKRVTSGAADAQQSASVNLFQVGRLMRIGGSGLTQGVNLLGCKVQAKRNGSQVLPPPSTLPAPFDVINLTTTPIRVVPVVAFSGVGRNGSDLVLVTAGDSESGHFQYPIAAAPTGGSTPTIPVSNSNGINAADVLLAVNLSTLGNCNITQVATTQPVYANDGTATPQSINLATSSASSPPTPYYLTGGLSGLYSIGDVVINLGQHPRFLLFGINSQDQLVEYDLLNVSGVAFRVLAENVADFRVMYGVDTDADNVVDSWTLPTGSSWSAATLLKGDTTASTQLDKLRAIRVAMVLRAAQQPSTDSAASSYTVFPSTASPQTISVATGYTKYPHQVYETVLPLRNMKFVPPIRGS